MIEIEDLVVERGSRVPLARVTTSVAAGELLLVTGNNGAGKSTLLNTVAGLLRPAAGRVTIAGETPRTACRRGWVGLVQQAPGYPALVTVADIMRYVALVSGRKPAALEEAVRLTEIGNLLRRQTGGLSGGERRRLALAAVWLSSPERLVLLDEPTDSLDEIGRQTLVELVSRFRSRNRAVVVVSHRPDDWTDHEHTELKLTIGERVS